MLLKRIAMLIHGVLSIGAFYTGISMMLGTGVFNSFPPEWIGVMPFSNWLELAVFGIVVFGAGNAAAVLYAFRKNSHIFLLSGIMGILLFGCTVLAVDLAGEWYLPTGGFLVASTIQLSIGALGLTSNRLSLHSSS